MPGTAVIDDVACRVEGESLGTERPDRRNQAASA